MDILDPIPAVPVASAVESAINWLDNNLRTLWQLIGLVLETASTWLINILTAPPLLISILIAAALAFLARGWKFALFVLLAFVFVDAMGVWKASMQTLAIVLIAAGVAVVIAIPIGILAARKALVSAAVRPVLDFMQTLPPFVYLIPAIFFFSIGNVPGIVATVVFAMPPGVRLTQLGIRQVDREMVEAGEAFGARPRQILARIQLPLALPSIMAGINQVIMLSLSMVVLAGIVGTEGLGSVIYTAILRVNIGVGFEAGFAVVVIAMFLDRLTGAFGGRGTRRPGTAVGRLGEALRFRRRDRPAEVD